jgi:dihydropyrimidinase
VTWDSVVTGGSAVLPGSGLTPCDIAVTGGRIAALLAPGTGSGQAAEEIDARGLVAFPGVVDPHAHFGLGSPDDWRTESVAAAHGGVTTVLNYIQDTRSYTLAVPEEQARAEAASIVDFAIHCILMNEQHLGEIDALVRDHGVLSFKYFSNFKGDEGAYLGVQGTDSGFFYALCRAIARHPDAILAVHPENIEVVWRLAAEVKASGRDELSAWTDARPDFVEAHDMLTAFLFARQTGCRIYIPHLSAACGLDAYRRLGADQPGVHVETCPHYLVHTQDSPLGSLLKVNPPVRTAADADALWDALARGEIVSIGSDHIARERARKEGSIWKASAGFPGNTTLLPVLLGEGHFRRGQLSLEQVAALTSANPARIFGLGGRKGEIAVGRDADLALVDLGAERVVDSALYGSHAGYSVYDGMRLRGWPVLTMVRGTTVMREGQITAAPGHGRLVPRRATASTPTATEASHG